MGARSQHMDHDRLGNESLRLLVVLIVVYVLGGHAMARNLRLVDANGVDATDIHSLVATATRGCQSDRERMVALWAYITRNPYYHWCEARENPEGTTELGVVYDPITLFNVYGTVICYQVSDVLSNLAEAAGIATRTRGVPGHKVMEAFYEGKWHLFDAQYDLAAYYVGDDGKTIISLAELCKDPGKYIRNPKFPSDPFFPFDHYGGNFWPWEAKEYVIEHFFHPGVPDEAYVFAPYIARGHTIHFDLRRGEKLIRSFSNEGHWFCPPEFQAKWKTDKTQRWVDQGPHDPRNPENTYANGVLVYEPDWAANESNFHDGLYDGQGFLLREGKVHPKPGTTAEVIFRVQNPYLIVGDPGKLHVSDDSRDGAIFEADFFRKDATVVNSVSISCDNGISWKEVWENSEIGRRTVRLDLTNEVEGTYGYLIGVALAGRQPEDASLGNMRLRNGLFFSPIPLPAVKPGQNRFAFSLTEKEGGIAIRPDLGDEQDWRRFFTQVEGLKYDSKFTGYLSPIDREGHAIIEVAAPPNSKLQWLTVHGSFGVAVGDGKSESAEILFRTDLDGEWQSAWKSDFSPRNDKWRWDDSIDIRLAEPAEKCYVKFALKRRRRMSLNKVRIYAHYLRSKPPLTPGSVTVTHDWIEDGELKTYTIRPDIAGQTYTVCAKGKNLRNRSITIEVANEY